MVRIYQIYEHKPHDGEKHKESLHTMICKPLYLIMENSIILKNATIEHKIYTKSTKYQNVKLDETTNRRYSFWFPYSWYRSSQI